MKSDMLFSDTAIGVITNHGDHHFSGHEILRLRELGLRHFVCVRPLACLGSPDVVLELIETLPLRWVYGKAEVSEHHGNPVAFPAGEAELRWYGILLRYFAPFTDEGEPVRLWKIWSAEERERLVLASAAALLPRSEAHTVVLGSGCDFEHWAFDVDGDVVTPREGPGHDKGLVGPVHLAPNRRHLIVHPTMRTHRYSIIDPEQHRMVILDT